MPDALDRPRPSPAGSASWPPRPGPPRLPGRLRACLLAAALATGLAPATGCGEGSAPGPGGGAARPPTGERLVETGEGRMPTGEGRMPTGAGLEAPADAPLVVFLGDSLTAGFGVAGDDAFPAVIARRLADGGTPIRLVNAGVSGDTTAGGRRRLDWLLRQDPEVVVIALGANDGLRGLDLDEARANLVAIVEGTAAAGAQPVLCGVRIPTNYGPDYADAFAALFPDVAERTGATFVPFLLDGVGGIDAMNLADGIHPNPAGHRRIAATVAPVLAGVLDRDGGAASP